MIYKCTRIRWIVAFTVILGDKYKLCQYFLYVSTWVDPWYFSRVVLLVILAFYFAVFVLIVFFLCYVSNVACIYGLSIFVYCPVGVLYFCVLPRRCSLFLCIAPSVLSIFVHCPVGVIYFCVLPRRCSLFLCIAPSVFSIFVHCPVGVIYFCALPRRCYLFLCIAPSVFSIFVYWGNTQK